MPDGTDSGTTLVDEGANINGDLKAEQNKATAENGQPKNLPQYRYWKHGWRSHLHPDRKEDMLPQDDADTAKSVLGSEQNMIGTGDGFENGKTSNHPRHGPCRHAWRRRPHLEWKENMPIPSDSDMTNGELAAGQKEWWKIYEAQKFSKHPDVKEQNEHPNFPDKFDGPFPGDQQFGPPFPFYYPYHHHHHHHHFHCGGRFHGPKPTLQERLQREFDFI